MPSNGSQNGSSESRGGAHGGQQGAPRDPNPASGHLASASAGDALSPLTPAGSGAVSASRATSLQNYHLLAFRKALHPEFFGIEGRQRVQHGDYETEAWIFRGGHSLRFQLNGFCLSEVVVEHIDQIPDRGLISAHPCAGERDFEEKVADNLVYMTSVQTETLSDHLYLGTYKELMQHARDNDSLFAAWTDAAGRPNLSMIDVQHFRTEVHVQGYHLRSDCGLVLRTQSMLQIVVPKKGAPKSGVDGAAERTSERSSARSDDRGTGRAGDRGARPASGRGGRDGAGR